ncbi:hypothetical protein ACIBF1_30010 [Spirillospora sp. NPDC050679]
MAMPATIDGVITNWQGGDSMSRISVSGVGVSAADRRRRDCERLDALTRLTPACPMTTPVSSSISPIRT